MSSIDEMGKCVSLSSEYEWETFVVVYDKMALPQCLLYALVNE